MVYWSIKSKGSTGEWEYWGNSESGQTWKLGELGKWKSEKPEPRVHGVSQLASLRHSER